MMMVHVCDRCHRETTGQPVYKHLVARHDPESSQPPPWIASEALCRDCFMAVCPNVDPDKEANDG